MATEFTLPELGENIENGDVIRVLVAAGDTVAADQPVVELETDKATIEVPSPAAGLVLRVAVKEGETIAVGQLLLVIEALDAREPDAASEKEVQPQPAETAPPKASPQAPKAPHGAPETSQAPRPPAVAADDPSAPSAPESPGAAAPSRGRPILAAPSVRHLAREFGVELADVTGSGARGRVVADDIKSYAKRTLQQVRQAHAPVSEPELPDFAKWGSIERTRMRSVRRATARQMSTAWRTVPHVTQHDKADLTHFESTRQQLKKESPDIPLTVTSFTVKVLAAALKEFPQFNASIDIAREEIVYKHYINIGVAVDTERGLLVPVVRNADEKTLVEVSQEIATVAEKARSKAVTLDDLQGGTFTLTNLGGLGGTSFTPIINYPEVAILGLSRSSYQPVLFDQEFKPRLMMPLSLSYDHRLIDGAVAVRFLRWVAVRLEQPLRLSLDQI